MTEPPKPESECFGRDCTTTPVYRAERIIIYPLGDQPLEGSPTVDILVCMKHKNDKDIDNALIESSITSARRHAPNMQFGREKGEVYWQML